MHSIMHPMACFPALKLRSEELWACIRYLWGPVPASYRYMWGV
jgi:hypothetical protein